MDNNEFFWSYFETTGQIGAYLLVKNMSKDYDLVSYKKPRMKRKLG